MHRIASIDNNTGAGTVSETRHYYGGDERLRALQRVSLTTGDGGLPITRGGVWEEYRYDPLGRRVLVRTRTDGNLCNNSNSWACTGSITRFVWAGDQILWELRAPGNGGTDANLEATDGGGNAYGRVSYSYAGGIDRPLVITKEAVATVIPHQNWRGMFANATTTTGALSQVPVDWPGFETTPWHEPRSSVQNWFGSVATGMRDASGQIYMRNRYYNPATGQFTQPDPIGLAGGLNSYGFAAGDPLSYSDPYGLKVDPEDARARRLWRELQSSARRASTSENAEERAAGVLLSQNLNWLKAAEITVTIRTQEFSGTVMDETGGASLSSVRNTETGELTGLRVRMDPQASARRHGVPAHVILAHELGHAYQIAVYGTNNPPLFTTATALPRRGISKSVAALRGV